MKKRSGHAETEASIGLWVCMLMGLGIGCVAGWGSGWDAGVRDAVAGRATVIEKPDGTTEAVKVKAVAARMEDER